MLHNGPSKSTFCDTTTARSLADRAFFCACDRAILKSMAIIKYKESLRAPAIPDHQTLQPLGVTATLAPSLRAPVPLRGITAKYASIFLRAEGSSETGMDTNKERVLAGQPNVGNTGSDANNTSAFQYLQERLVLAQTRKQMYKEYDDIEDDFPKCYSALDIFADNVCATDAYSEEVVSIVTDDERVGALFAVFKDVLKLDAIVRTRAREIARAGEMFDEIVYDDQGWISRLKTLPSALMERNEDEFGLLPEEEAFTQLDQSMHKEFPFYAWQVAHYRLLRRPDDIYGTGLFHPIRRLAKKLSVAEDALLLARLLRAHKKVVYNVPVDFMAPQERMNYLQDLKRQYRKRRVINPRTQKLDLETHPLAAEEDIFIGSTKENKVDVTEIGGDPSIGQIADIEYWENTLFAALMVPKAYLGVERDVNAKATLTEQDVQFARTVHRIQMALQEQIRVIFNRALILFGIDPMSVEYTLAFPAVSLIDELRNWEIENMKLEAAGKFKELFRPSDEWMLVEFLGFSKDEADDLIAEQQPEMVQVGVHPETGEPDQTFIPKEAMENPEKLKEFLSRRKDLEELFNKARILKNISERAKRRSLGQSQRLDRRKLAEDMKRFRSRSGKFRWENYTKMPGSGY